MAEGRPIPVRLSPDVISRLDTSSKRFHINRAGVIKLCLLSFLDHIDKVGSASLPLNWEEMLKSADGRRQRKSRKAKK